jgi:hypothetical protein
MPALPATLPVNVPQELTLPQDLTALASGQVPVAPAASPAVSVGPLLSALP